MSSTSLTRTLLFSSSFILSYYAYLMTLAPVRAVCMKVLALGILHTLYLCAVLIRCLR